MSSLFDSTYFAPEPEPATYEQWMNGIRGTSHISRRTKWIIGIGVALIVIAGICVAISQSETFDHWSYDRNRFRYKMNRLIIPDIETGEIRPRKPLRRYQ